ncbi:MAG: phytoene desaturase family protein [Bacteroidota bacterium]
MQIAIIGAGIGGLSSACLLAADGHDVQVFEANAQPGGKLNQVKAQGYRFDTGPSLLTMPQILDRLFAYCDAQRFDFLEFMPLSPLCRYYYPDGVVFDNYSDLPKTLAELDRFAPQDKAAYTRFLGYAADLYDRTADAFLYNPLADLTDLRDLAWTDLLKIDSLSTVSKRVDQSFSDPHLQQFFKRFTTYNGSSPYQAPATLNVIPYVELCMGGYYVHGGLYRIAEALEALGRSLGVTYHYETPVDEITVTDGAASGLSLADGTSITADLVISNSDAHETYTRLLPPESVSKRVINKQQRLEPSCSGFVMLLGSDRQFEALKHHTIFFSEDYRREFEQIFQTQQPPQDPTIYVANTSYSEPQHAPPGGSNLFILVNVPYLTNQHDWVSMQQSYGDHIIDQLEQRGLTDLRSSIQFRKHITPQDFYDRYRSNRGSIYGTSSNQKTAAFVRPRNRSPYIQNLYLTGGSTHPGGGIPLVILSAFHAHQLLNRDHHQ